MMQNSNDLSTITARILSPQWFFSYRAPTRPEKGSIKDGGYARVTLRIFQDDLANNGLDLALSGRSLSWGIRSCLGAC